MSSEFDLINDWFHWSDQHSSVIKGVGDDAAVVAVPADKQLIVTTDTLISGVHFPHQTNPHAIGHKALAVNLSDLAAMGADPAWFTLAITLPESNEAWLKAFSTGLKELASEHGISLIGGDTTKGTLSITITAMGLASTENLMLRSSAKHNDAVYVTGSLGDAAAGLPMVQGGSKFHSDNCIKQLNYPQPRVTESKLIRQFANACIDISDGLLADCQHVLDESNVGCVLELADIPLSKELQQIDRKTALEYALTGGDDYELLFTVSADKDMEFKRYIQQQKLICYGIGRIDQRIQGIQTSEHKKLDAKGYNHFTESHIE